MNLLTSFRELPFSVEMLPVWLKHIYSVLCALIWMLMPAAACSRLCSWVLVWVGAFARSAMSSALSASVIVFVGYLLLLFFVSLKLFSLILSINVLSMWSRHMIKRDYFLNLWYDSTWDWIPVSLTISEHSGSMGWLVVVLV